MVNVTIQDVFGAEFSAGTFTLDDTPRTIIKKCAIEHPEEAASLFGGTDEMNRAINTDFSIDSTRSMISLVTGEDFIPLDWDKALNAQSDEVKGIVKKFKDITLSVSVTMPNA